MSSTLESVWIGRDPGLLDAMLDFYAPDALRVVDVCCNERRMWKGSKWASRVAYYDIDPMVEPDLVASWDALPDDPGTVDVLVYDPPHLPRAAASPLSHAGYRASFGLSRAPEGDNVADLYPPFLREASRVLRDGGLVLAKIKDYVHNHRYQWCLEMFNRAAREAGFTPCDLVIKRDPKGGALTSSKWKRRCHARNVHCYWVVLRKGTSCEPRSRR